MARARDMAVRGYFQKMRGGATSPPGVSIAEVFWAVAGSAIGIGACGYLSLIFFEPYDSTLLIGSFGASAVLVYAAIKSPLAQPRNLIGGHVVSGLMGVLAYKLFGADIWIASSIGVSSAIGMMLVTKTLHPPGGATALIAVIGGQKIHDLGFMYAFLPAGTGALVLLVVALLVNNIPANRRYPEYWV
ncbi:MAG: HPP family protein [Nitrospiraceae bacterium]|nr:HPP family protein [Nitrospiraceae bacterium]